MEKSLLKTAGLVTVSFGLTLTGAAQADALIDGAAYEQAVKGANAVADQLKQHEKPQWLESGLRIVRAGEDCSAPKNELSFAPDIDGKLMTCAGPQGKWTDAAPIVRAIDQASFSCGAGIPGLC
jgi:hypothetical protein